MIGPSSAEANLNHLLIKLWQDDEGQDIAEYAVMRAVILVWWSARRLGGSKCEQSVLVSSQLTSVEFPFPRSPR